MAFTQFITDATLTASLAATLKKTVADLNAQAYIATIVTESNRKAMNEVNIRVLGQGYTPAQVALFDRGVEFQTDFGLYWALERMMPLEGWDEKRLAIYDRRDELSHTLITVGGVEVDPLDLTFGGATGTFNGESDLFGTPVDPADPNLGQPLVW